MKTLVIAPHPDDELLGCGGTLLRRRKEGADIGWILVSRISEEGGYPKESVVQRSQEIQNVREGLGVRPKHMYSLGFPTRELDLVPMKALVGAISRAIEDFQPTEVLLPFFGDAHSDHRRVFEAGSACMKWFRAPSIERVLLYETPSETDVVLGGLSRPFAPNSYVDIGLHFEEKLTLVSNYGSEIQSFPFPRSFQALRATAEKRGAECGFEKAEAFELVMERLLTPFNGS